MHGAACGSLVEKIVAKIVSVHSGSNDDLSKEAHESIQVKLDGSADDEVTVEIYETPSWLVRPSD